MTLVYCSRLRLPFGLSPSFSPSLRSVEKVSLFARFARSSMPLSQSQILLIGAASFFVAWFLLASRKRKEKFSVSGFGYRGQQCGCASYKDTSSGDAGTSGFGHTRNLNYVYPKSCACSPAMSSPVNWDLRAERCQECLQTNKECVNGMVWCRACSGVCSKFV